MARSNFENLRVYCLCESVADAVWEVVKNWPPLARNTVGQPMIRAADSIGANIAEGVGQGTYEANRRLVRIARGSLYETKHWLHRAFRRNLLKPDQIEQLKSDMDSLGPTLNAYLLSISRKCKTSSSTSKKAADAAASTITTNH